MKITSVFSVLALLLAFSASTYALDTKCVVVGPAASELSYIAQRAADAQKVADEMEGYLRNSNTPSWEGLSYQMAYLEENIRQLRKAIHRFESSEPKLTEAQERQLERLNAGLATLTIFANNTNRLIAEKRLIPHRDALAANAKAMGARAGIIREAARNLRVVQAA
jgi:biopolymer transport protein ExbB/TolQ